MTAVQLCTFAVHDRRFGVPITDVAEINNGSSMRTVPRTPDCVAGLVNIRGHVNLILDLRVLMGYPAAAQEGARRLLLFKPHIAADFGIGIEGTPDIITVDAETIIDRRSGADGPVPEGGDRRQARADLVVGVCSQEDPLILVLRPSALAEAPKVFARLAQAHG